MTNTIKHRVLKHLQKQGNISPREIYLDYHAGSPTKVISDLRKDGHIIISVSKKHPTTGQRYVRYHMSA